MIMDNYQIKRFAKSRYKYEVRRLRRREQFIRREKMAAALASVDSKSFWQQVHRVNKSKSCTPASSVDGVAGADHISHLFSTKLRGILNSQDACGRDVSLLSSLSSSLSVDDLVGISISEECVDFRGDQLIHALPAIRSFASLLFTAILRHGYMPEQLRNYILVPIPKANKDPANSDSYHPISLASGLHEQSS